MDSAVASGDKRYRDLLAITKREASAFGANYETFVREACRTDLLDAADLCLPLQVSADADAVDVLISSAEGGKFSTADLAPSLSAQLCAQYLCASSVTVERLIHVKRRLVYFNESDALYCISLLILLDCGEELHAFCKYLDFVRGNRLLGEDGGESADFMKFAFYLRDCVGSGQIERMPSFKKAYKGVSALWRDGREATIYAVLDERLALVHNLVRKQGERPSAFALAPVELLALIKLMNSSAPETQHIIVPSHVSIPSIFVDGAPSGRKWPDEVSRFIESVKGDQSGFIAALPV